MNDKKMKKTNWKSNSNHNHNRNHNRNHMTSIWVVVFVVVTLLFGAACTTQSPHQRRGIELFHSGDYDEAVTYFEKAVVEKPSRHTKLLLFQAKLNSYFQHLAQARKLRELDKKEEAVKEYNLALGVFANNKKVIEELRDYLDPPKKVDKVFVSKIKPPITLNVDPNEKMSLKLRSTPITNIFKVVGKSYGINFVFDKDFRDFVYSLEVENIGFYEIMGQLCMVGNAEYRVLDAASVLIYPNTTFKKRTFGLRGVKVFYLSNTKAEDAKKLMMTVFRDQQVQVQEDSNLNTLIVKGDYGTLLSVERFLNSVDKRQSEVAIDVEILEVTKNLIQALGVNFGDAASPSSSLSAEFPGADGTMGTKTNVKNLKDANFFLTVPTAALSFLESDDNNRLIARPNLRGVSGEEIEFMVGDEVPVPQTQFQAGAAGGVTNIPVTSYTYRNVGVEVKVTPYVHKNNEVTLKVKLTINSISSYQGDFPVFGKREVKNVIRLKEGETNIIGGFIKDEMRGGMSGIRGLARIPILGKLFGSHAKNIKQTDLVFSITPRIIRHIDISAMDEDAVWADMQAAAHGGQGQGARRVLDDGPGGDAQVDPSENPRGPGKDSVVISPAKRRVPINATSYFTLRVNATSDLSSLAIGGSISGGSATIEDIKTDFFGGRKVQVMSNFSGTSFDLGYSFPADVKMRPNVVGQMKVKFTEKGNYTINLSSLSAISKDRQNVELTGNSAEVEVY